MVLPRGVASIARDVPNHDLELIAPTTSLVAREGTHPAIIELFVQAATRIHDAPGWIARAGQFPSAAANEFPLAKDAERFYRTGPPLLQRYLPFWLANLIDRMWVALFSIVAVLIPLSRLVPPLYRFRIRSRIFRWYRNLRMIEDELEERQRSREELAESLDKLEARVSSISVPLGYAEELYALRQQSSWCAHACATRGFFDGPTLAMRLLALLSALICSPILAAPALEQIRLPPGFSISALQPATRRRRARSRSARAARCSSAHAATRSMPSPAGGGRAARHRERPATRRTASRSATARCTSRRSAASCATTHRGARSTHPPKPVVIADDLPTDAHHG